MSKAKGKINVNGGAGGSRWAPRSDVKKRCKKARRAQGKKELKFS